MPLFEPCIPTKAAKVPDRPDWIHEVKHDGYRLIVQRDDKRVRLFTRNGHDWTGRFPRIVGAAMRNRHSSFVHGERDHDQPSHDDKGCDCPGHDLGTFLGGVRSIHS